MLASLEESVRRHADLTERLAMPGLAPRELLELNKERARLEPIVTTYTELEQKKSELADNKALLEEKDADLRAMATEEIAASSPL